MVRVLVAISGVLLAAMPVASRPYVVDDLLRTEGLGSVLISPGGRWMVFEKRIAFEDAAGFRYNAMEVLRDRLYRVDLRHPRNAEPLVPIEPGVATAAYGFSPHGRYFAFGRLEGQHWTLGVVTMATGAVRRFDLAPDYNPFRPTLAWVTDDQLVAIVAPDKALPWMLDLDSKAPRLLSSLWPAQQSGHIATVMAIGSGRALSETPRRLPSDLVLVDVASGSTRTLTSGEFGALTVSASGRHVAVLEDGDPIPALVDPPMEGGSDPRRRHLRIVDIASGRTWQPCPACDLPVAPPVWSPTDERLVFFAREAGQSWSQGKIRLVDADRERVGLLALASLRPVIGGVPIVYASVSMDWFGGDPIVYALDSKGGERADWYRIGEGSPIALTSGLARTTSRLARTSDGALLMIEGASAWMIGHGAPRCLTAGADAVDAVTASDADRQRAGTGSQIVATRTADGFTGFAVVGGPPDARFQFPVVGVTQLQPLGVVGSGRSIVAIETQIGGIGRLLVQGRSGKAITVATLNQGLGIIDIARAVALHYRLADGEAMTSWLYLPLGVGRTRLPLLVMPYGGHVFTDRPPSQDGRALDIGTSSVATVVGHGYAVLLPSMPPIKAREHGTLDFSGQILPAVDAAIATGWVDPRRLGLWGHSFGAYDVAMTVARTNRFAAALVANGLYDVASGVGAFTPWTRLDPGNGQSILPMAGWAETGQPQLFATPWANPRRYVDNSVIYHADRVSTPMLIVAADQDVAPLQQGELLFSALYRQNKDAELLSYWGESHVLVSPANIRDFYTRAFRWFDDHFDRAIRLGAQTALPTCTSDTDRSRHEPSAQPAARAVDPSSDRCA